MRVTTVKYSTTGKFNKLTANDQVVHHYKNLQPYNDGVEAAKKIPPTTGRAIWTATNLGEIREKWCKEHWKEKYDRVKEGKNYENFTWVQLKEACKKFEIVAERKNKKGFIDALKKYEQEHPQPSVVNEAGGGETREMEEAKENLEVEQRMDEGAEQPADEKEEQQMEEKEEQEEKQCSVSLYDEVPLSRGMVPIYCEKSKKWGLLPAHILADTSMRSIIQQRTFENVRVKQNDAGEDVVQVQFNGKEGLWTRVVEHIECEKNKKWGLFPAHILADTSMRSIIQKRAFENVRVTQNDAGEDQEQKKANTVPSKSHSIAISVCKSV